MQSLTRTTGRWWVAAVAANAFLIYSATFVRTLLERDWSGNVAVLASLRLAPCRGGATNLFLIRAFAIVVVDWRCWDACGVRFCR